MWQTVRICYPWHFRYNFPLKTPGHRAWVLQLKRPSVGFLWSITFLPHRWRHTPRKQPLTGRFWAAMLKAHNSEQNHFFEWEKRQKSTKKTSNINVRVLSINLKNGYFFLLFSFKSSECRQLVKCKWNENHSIEFLCERAHSSSIQWWTTLLSCSGKLLWKQLNK